MANLNGTDNTIRVTAIGGGTGLSALLRGLKRNNTNIDISAVVTTFDDGGSSGLLRREFGYPGLGDLRQCLLALASDDSGIDILSQILEFRFPRNSALVGHSLGNLLLAGLLAKTGNLSDAIEEASKMLRINGNVIPVSLENGHLCAELYDGHIIFSESAIDLREAADPAIKRIFLRNPVQANPTALNAALNANAIILGPGDLFTSILPNLLPNGMREAISKSNAKLIFVCNLTTKHGETDGFSASNFVSKVNEYLNPSDHAENIGRSIDAVIINKCDMPTAQAIENNQYNESPVNIDEHSLHSIVDDIVIQPMLGNVNPARHNPDTLVNTILNLIEHRPKPASLHAYPGPSSPT